MNEQKELSNTKKKKRLLSRETLDGIHLTGTMKCYFMSCTHECIFFAVNAFVELVPTIFKTEGVKFFLSEHVSQDPLEKFFGVQRQRGRDNENPDMQSFCKNTQAIKVISSICRDSVKGNCRGLNSKRPLQALSCEDNQPLQKRRRKK